MKVKVPAAITDTFKGLVSRRLWPVAVVLLAALVAVPFVLTRSATPVAPNATTATVAADGSTESLVSLDGTTDAGRRRVLGDAKDPFQPAPTPKKKTSAKKAKTAAKDADTSTPATGDATTGGTTSGGTTTGGTTTGGTTTGSDGSSGSGSGSTKNSVAVRFGTADSDALDALTVSALEALPSKDEPIAIFLGLENHGKTAVFMLGDGVTVEGDGACNPSPTQCDTVRLKAGETEFLTVSGSQTLTDGEYQLDVVKLRK